MDITDAQHLLDDQGAMAPRRSTAPALAGFHAGVVAYATDDDKTGVVAAHGFNCRTVAVRVARAQDDAIAWSCWRCKAAGRMSNRQRTLWDRSDRPDASRRSMVAP